MKYVKVALACLSIAYVVSHIAALTTDAFNWDEFALFYRAEHTIQTGEFLSGGRPGLGVVALLPFIHDCNDHIATALAARLLWCCFTFAELAGVFFLLRLACRRSAHAWRAAALGTAALGLVPLFLRWSLQVRTDQPAIACAIWAGVALLASRARLRWSLLAGGLLGLGYLFSQKAIYIGALGGLLAAGDLFIDGVLKWRRELLRLALVVAGFVVAVVAYKTLVPLFYSSPRAVALEDGLELFDWLRWVLRYRLYTAILTSVIPHVVLLLLVVLAAGRAFGTRSSERRQLVVALAVMMLGVAVGWFHAACFPYFWLTIGVFPACAIALGWSGIRVMLPRAHLFIEIGAWTLMIALAIRYRSETLHDTQATQRASFDFLDQSIPEGWRGFQPDGAMVCRRDPMPFPVYLGRKIANAFVGADAETKRQEFLDEFRTRPVSFLIRTPRLNYFPREVKEFWRTHYVPYTGALELAGARIEGPAASTRTIDLIVSGTYRWRSTDARIIIDGRTIMPGEAVVLPRGTHEVTLVDEVPGGSFVLDVPSAPPPSGKLFYPVITLLELSGIRRDWW